MSVLYDSLVAAGLPIESARDDGEVVFTRGVSLTEAQLAQYNQIRNDFLGIVAPIEQVFHLPLRAPSITVKDVFVESRQIKDDPAAALAEALTEASKPLGTAKSLDLIARSLAVVVADIEARLKKKNI
jgi:hypothetical protein